MELLATPFFFLFNNLFILKILIIYSFFTLSRVVDKENTLLLDNSKMFAVKPYIWFIFLIPFLGELWMLMFGLKFGDKFDDWAKYHNGNGDLFGGYHYKNKMILVGALFLGYNIKFMLIGLNVLNADPLVYTLETAYNILLMLVACSLFFGNIINKRDILRKRKTTEVSKQTG